MMAHPASDTIPNFCELLYVNRFRSNVFPENWFIVIKRALTTLVAPKRCKPFHAGFGFRIVEQVVMHYPGVVIAGPQLTAEQTMGKVCPIVTTSIVDLMEDVMFQIRWEEVAGYETRIEVARGP